MDSFPNVVSDIELEVNTPYSVRRTHIPTLVSYAHIVYVYTNNNIYTKSYINLDFINTWIS